VPYEIAVMTNITYEHLDYHGTFKNYLEAKRRLFRLAARHGRKFGVVNAEDPNAKAFIDSTPRSLSYGIGAGQLQASDVVLAGDHSTFTAKVDDDTYNVRINIPGDFNVSNSLAAVAVGRELGLSKDQIEQGIAALAGVEGRMTVIDEGQPFKVIVDFAGTPDAFTRLFTGLRPATKGKLIVVFGSPGRRDEAKRPVQGEIAGQNADELIITEEDDRDIDGNEIMRQIAAGAEKAGMKQGENLHLILNREEAIGFALTRASHPDDLVIILGKGHEKTIERGDVSYPWSDIDVTTAALKELMQR
jgi:UDP-N-acetylmuramoyl-L-alanyl-D-glutamate--2,6-diaminopimelate ligase